MSCVVWCAPPAPRPCHTRRPPPPSRPPQYERTLRDGFGARDRLLYGSCGWGDAEAEELAATLREVAHPEVVELDLSGNGELTSLAALGAAIGDGALASLQKLNLSCCAYLTSLPAELASLASLRTLNLICCFALTRLPDLSGLPQLKVEDLPDHLKAWGAGGRMAMDADTGWAEDPFPADATEISLSGLRIAELPEWLCRHASLRTLHLEHCYKLTSLPAELASLASLQTLNLIGTALTRMPDLSGLPLLNVYMYLPDHLHAWEAGGRKAGTFDLMNGFCATLR